jgi:hypothetical protein
MPTIEELQAQLAEKEAKLAEVSAQVADLENIKQAEFGKGVGHAFQILDTTLADLGFPKEGKVKTSEHAAAVVKQLHEKITTLEQNKNIPTDVSVFEAKVKAAEAQLQEAQKQVEAERKAREELVIDFEFASQLTGVELAVPDYLTEDKKPMYKDALIKSMKQDFFTTYERRVNEDESVVFYDKTKKEPALNSDRNVASLQDLLKDKFSVFFKPTNAPKPAGVGDPKPSGKPITEFKDREAIREYVNNKYEIGSPTWAKEFNKLLAENNL